MSLTLLKTANLTVCTYSGSFKELMELLNNLRAGQETGTLSVNIMTGGITGMEFKHKEREANFKCCKWKWK